MPDSPLPRRAFPLDRYVLFSTIVAMPLLDLVIVGPVSGAWLLFGGVTAYVLLRSGRALMTVFGQRTLIAALAFVAIAFCMESFRFESDYAYLVSFGQTIVAAALIATLCRDRRALLAALYGLVGLSALLSFVLFISFYEQLTASAISGFQDASQLRAETYGGQTDLLPDLNRLSFLIGLGGVVSLALSLKAKGQSHRYVLVGLATFCFVGAALPLSRSGIVTSLVSALVVLSASGGHRLRKLAIGSVIVVVFYAVAPGATLERLGASGGPPATEGRLRVFEGAVSGLPAYWAVGVGARNYWNDWAITQGITDGLGRALGVHNSFLQVWVFWGVPGLVAFLGLSWSAYRCLPSRCGRDASSLALLGAATALGVQLLFSHNFYSKDVGVVLGLLVGARLWVWPTCAGLRPAWSISAVGRPRLRSRMPTRHAV